MLRAPVFLIQDDKWSCILYGITTFKIESNVVTENKF